MSASTEELIKRAQALRTPDECERMASNCLDRGKPEVALAARSRGVQLRAQIEGPNNDVERAAFEAIAAYESVLRLRHGGKDVKASRTRQMMKRWGVVTGVERVVGRAEDSVGYAALQEHGLEGFAFEHVVLRFPDAFESSIRLRAQARLDGGEASSASEALAKPTLSRRPRIADLLVAAGLNQATIAHNRAFLSKWIWHDGDTTVATVWQHELDEGCAETQAIYQPVNPSLTGNRRTRALEHRQVLADTVGRPIKVILQSKYAKRDNPNSAVAEFRTLDPSPWYCEKIGADLVLTRASLATAPSGDRFKHGDKRTWELALDAITELGGTADPQVVLVWITERYPSYKENNLGADLAMLSVNSPSRTAYGTNVKPRRTDQGSEFDRLFKIGSGPGVKFEVYDPAQHGIWEIYADASSGNRNGMSVRQVVSPLTQALDDAVREAEQAGDFDVNAVEDARRRVFGAIVRRRGQPAFRSALIKAYGGACAITGCSLLAVLEAAHVHPYKGDHTNLVANGLLLRADIHTLFDLGLIAVDSVALTVQVSAKLAGTEYASLQGIRLRTPVNAVDRVSLEALDWHRSRSGW